MQLVNCDKIAQNKWLSMAQVNYPYLDLTVLPEIRTQVITSRAALLFDESFTTVLWANGEGASLLGSPALRDLLDGDISINPTMRRQMAAAIEQLDDSDEVSAVARIRRGMQSRLLGFSVRHIQLPQNEKAVLLITENLRGRDHSESDMARSAVDCLDGYSHASAILGAEGELLASSEHFGTLDVKPNELAKLVKEVATEEDRLVKRLIETASGSLAAGIARLSDDPASHILIIADSEVEVANQPESEADEQEEAGEATAPPKPDIEVAPESNADSEETPSAPTVGAFSNRRKAGTSSLARWYFKQPTAQAEAQNVDPESTGDDSSTSEDEQTGSNTSPADTAPRSDVEIVSKTESEDRDETPHETVTAATIEDTIAPEPTSGLIQEIQHTEGTDTPDQTQSMQSNSKAKTDLSSSGDDFEFAVGSKPIRFVWDMDANNEFRSVSPEFEKAVGPNAANIIGLTWSELCQLHEIENGDDISALLNKGDTWSGKTVMWPVEGTDLQVPIDLAGLPSYGRNRAFEGFNGFGIVRTADAVVDPRAAGLKLSPKTDEFGTTDEDFSDTSAKSSEEEIQKDDTAKIVDLETRRNSKNERSLSTDEQETFEEIGEQLSDENDTSFTGSQSEDDDKPDEFTPSAFAGPSSKAHRFSGSSNVDSDTVGTPDHNVDTSILARLPIAVLVYRNSDLLFANQKFFEQTGYADLSQLAKAGGIVALFGQQADDDNATQFNIYHANGKQLGAQANLQRVPWDEDRAMLLTLRHDQTIDDGNGPEHKSDQIGHNSGEGSGDNGPNDSKSSADPQGTPSESATSSAQLLALNNAASQHDDLTKPAFGGLGAEDLRDILDTATDGVVILTDEGIIRALNKSAEALFDVDPDAVLDQSVTKILAPESHRSALDYLSGISGTGVASLMNDGREIIGKTAKGGLIPLFMTIGKLQQTNACCAVVRDITQWKKAEEELLSAKSIAESASAQKTEFLAKVSHEIRTPLNAIIGFSDMMIEERFGKIDNDRYRGYLRDIHRSGNHVLELVNDLLDISKIEAGKMELEFDACDLNTTVSETVALTQPDANKERIIIRTSLSAVVPKVVADPRSLRQIILNLVSNSIKYTKPGGQVIVSTVYEESGEVVLRVRDTGIGMSELELAHALKPFQQVNAETNTQGTGLGLPLTKAMVEANRARFEIESTPEEGTLVEIYFPNQRVLADR